MTRLYVDIHCERCGEAYAVDTGAYFGKRIGDEPVKQGICTYCRIEEMMETKKGDENE